MFSAFVLMGLIIPFFANPAPTCPLGGHSKLLSILRTQKLVSSHIFGSNSIEEFDSKISKKMAALVRTLDLGYALGLRPQKKLTTFVLKCFCQ